MRRFEDEQGRAWDAVVGRASWGSLYALFVPVAGTDAVRQTPLRASSTQAADRELSELDEPGLRALFERSEQKVD